MLPIITIIGRPNVGKSTLFNYLTRSRDALVADVPGLTRDRQYGVGKLGDKPYIVVDTGGIAESDDPVLAKFTEEQVAQAIAESSVILFMVDAKAGLVSADMQIASRLREQRDKVILVVNKADRENADVVRSEFFQLGLGDPHAIAASEGRGVPALVRQALAPLPETTEDAPKAEGVRIAVIGRPNVGKSTLINRILGEERVIVLDRPGTTRDSIFVPFEHRGKHYTLIDTAGVRRRTKVTDYIEKLSVIKTLQAIKDAQVVIVVFSAQEGIGEQDLRLLGYALEMGKALVIAINKWDHLDEYQREQVKQAVDRRLDFVTFARRYFISAKHGTGVGNLYHAIDEAYESATKQISTPKLTQALMEAVKAHQPPLVGGRRIRLRYAHVGGYDPLTFVIHGKQVNRLPGAYQRFLMNYFREKFELVGVPLQLEFKSDRNPFVSKEE